MEQARRLRYEEDGIMDYLTFMARDLRVEVTEDRERPIELFGLGALINSPVNMYDMWEVMLLPGVFDETLKNDDPFLAWNHDTDKPMARVSSEISPLELWVEGEKLMYKARPNNTSWARDAIESVTSQVAKGTSIGFDPIDAFAAPCRPGSLLPMQHIPNMKLNELSLSPSPRQKETSVEARQAAWAKYGFDEFLASEAAKGKVDLEAMRRRLALKLKLAGGSVPAL